MQDQDAQLRQMEKDLAQLRDNSVKRDKTIQGLVAALHEKNKEVIPNACYSRLVLWCSRIQEIEIFILGRIHEARTNVKNQ